MRRLTVSAAILGEVSAFLEGAGSRGTEGTGMLGGVTTVEGATATRFVAPDQEAGQYPSCWVQVTDQGKRMLATALDAGELWIARVHSHPGEAFHSSIDDLNPGLTAMGSLSIVVPYFGLGLRHGIRACAVFQRDEGGWHRLTEREVAERVVTVP